MEHTALLIIDVQNDYFPGEKMALPGSEKAAEATADILNLFRKHQWPIFHIQHTSIQKGSAILLPHTEGWKIYKCVEPKDGETIIEKNWPNSFRDTPLLEVLRKQQIQKLIITGMMTFMCVDATLRAAADLGFECTLIYDATATPPIEFEGVTCSAEQARATIASAMAFISKRVISAKQFLNTLQED